VYYRLAGWYYTDGKTLVDVLWMETLQELRKQRSDSFDLLFTAKFVFGGGKDKI
jgi:hypothetical protein